MMNLIMSLSHSRSVTCSFIYSWEDNVLVHPHPTPTPTIFFCIHIHIGKGGVVVASALVNSFPLSVQVIWSEAVASLIQWIFSPLNCFDQASCFPFSTTKNCSWEFSFLHSAVTVFVLSYWEYSSLM